MSTSDGASVSPQLAFQRLADLRLKNHSLESALQQVADLAKASVPGASEVSVSLVSKDKADTVVTTGQLAVDLDERQYERGYGPCLDAARTGQVMRIEDARTEPRWGDYTQTAVEHGVLSSVSVPITVQETPAVSAALNIYGTEAHAFAQEDVRTLGTLADHAESMLENKYAHHLGQQLVQQLAQALATRPVIDQAKGILMRDRGCTAHEAFDLLMFASRRSNRKLRDIAQDIVDSVVTQPILNRHTGADVRVWPNLNKGPLPPGQSGPEAAS